MKQLLAILALFLCGASVHAQTTPPVMVYSCPTTSAAGTNAKDYVSCGSTAWSWQPPPRRDADVPLVAACSTACGWGTSAVVTWRRPRDVAANESIAICTRNPALAAGSRASCSPESFRARDQVLIAPPVTNPPVNCVLGDFALKTTGAWSNCVAPGSRSRTDIWERTIATPAANGGTACPNPLPTETRTVTEDCVVPVVGLSTDRGVIYVGDSVPLTWFSAGVTACSVSWSPGSGVPLQQSTPVIVGPFTFAQQLQFEISCTGPNQPASSRVDVTVLTRTPTAWIHMDDVVAGRVKWGLVDTPNTGFDIKVTYFTAQRQETWATTWYEVMRRAAAEYAGIPYDETEARAQCERDCRYIDPASPLGLELAALRNSVTDEERIRMGIVE